MQLLTMHVCLFGFFYRTKNINKEGTSPGFQPQQHRHTQQKNTQDISASLPGVTHKQVRKREDMRDKSTRHKPAIVKFGSSWSYCFCLSQEIVDPCSGSLPSSVKMLNGSVSNSVGTLTAFGKRLISQTSVSLFLD